MIALFLALLFGPFGGGGGDGLDILPVNKPASIMAYMASDVKVYKPTAGGAGLTIVIVGPTTDPGTGDQSVSVTITGNLDAWGGEAIHSNTQDIPYDPNNLTVDAELEKKNSNPSGGPSNPGVDPPQDEDVVTISIDIPYAELDDGDPGDDDIGSTFGKHPTNGWGSRIVRG
jgi:hypothetical protein